MRINGNFQIEKFPNWNFFEIGLIGDESIYLKKNSYIKKFNLNLKIYSKLRS